MLKFFISIKTYLWLTGISIAVFLAGSLYIPKNLAVFSEINDIPLFRWLSENNADILKFYWIYLLIGLMLLLWISTVICSTEALIRRMSGRNIIRVLSPQIIHVAILFVLVGYFMSASSGYRDDASLGMHESRSLRGFSLEVTEIEFFKNPGENSTRWRVHLKIDNDQYMIELGRPVFYNGAGFYAKSAQEKKKRAIIGIIHDPGVVWELIGAAVFTVGAAGVFYSRFREEPVFRA